MKADIDAVEKYAVIHYTMSKYPDAEGRASEVFQSVANKIANDLANKAAARARNPLEAYPLEDVINAATIKKIWEQTEVYRCLYGPQAKGGHKYNASKITSTLQKAVKFGFKVYDNAVAGRQAPKPKTERDSKPVTGTLRKSENAGRQAQAPKREPEEEPQPDEKDIAAAQELWDGEDTLTKIITKLQEIHTGDDKPMMLILLLFLQGRIDSMDDETAYLTINAERGSGKSHLIETVKAFLPANRVHAGGMSNKFITRMAALWDGDMIIYDDVDTAEELIEIMRLCSTRKRRQQYHTLDKKNEPQICNLPLNPTFVISRVDADYGASHEQIMNRNIVTYIEKTEEHQRRIYDLIRGRGKVEHSRIKDEIRKIGEAFWTLIPEHIIVDTSISSHIGVYYGTEHRALEQCTALVACFAVYRHWKGDMEGWDEIDESGRPIIRAGEEDAKAAINLMNDLIENDENELKLSKAEKDVLDVLRSFDDKKTWTSISQMFWEMQKVAPDTINFGEQTFRRAVNGRKTKTGNTNGLIEKITGLQKTKKTKHTPLLTAEADGVNTPYDEYVWDPWNFNMIYHKHSFWWSEKEYCTSKISGGER